MRRHHSMNSLRYAKTAITFAALAVGLASAAEPEPPEIGVADIGRDNPFAAILKTTQASLETVPQTALVAETEEVPELFLDTVTLKFLDAKNLEKIVGRMVSRFGTVVANLKNNSLIICDTEENLVRIVAEIRKVDNTPQQIVVEVVILDVTLGDDTEVGVNWDLLSTQRYPFGYRQNFTTSRLRSTIGSAATTGDATAFNTVGLGGEVAVVTGTVRTVLHLIQQKRDVEIIAAPQVMVLSGQSANIKAVEEIPYTEITDTAQGGAMALTSTQFKEVGITLDVTATVTDGNNIFLTVDTTQNVQTGETQREVPFVDTRKANTSLLLKDGQVVVMGGLRREQKTKEVNQIPIVSAFPLVGELFKNRHTIIRYSELILLLAPHVYKNEPVPAKAQAKYDRIKNKPILSVPVKHQTKSKKTAPSRARKGGQN
jgi:type II secretory pathway component GspD/PulD (secretin)